MRLSWKSKLRISPSERRDEQQFLFDPIQIQNLPATCTVSERIRTLVERERQ